VPQPHERAIELAVQRFLRLPGVHAVGFGSKQVRGRRTGEPAVIFYVDRKRDPASIPEAERIPLQFEGYQTDVVESARAMPHADTDKYRPLEGGCQLAEAGSCNTSASYGTLGCIVLDTTNNNAACLLTNNHVLEDTDTGGRVYQPSADCNCCDSCPNVVAFKARGLYSARVDGAIATLKSGVDYNNEILEYGAVTGTYNLTDQDAASGTYVIRKRGRTTGATSGILASITYSTTVGGRSMTGQIRVDWQNAQPFSQKGDSGSVYVNQAMQVVGLNHAGPTSNDGSYGVGSPIADVLSELSVTLYLGTPGQMVGPAAADPLDDVAARVQQGVAAGTRGRELVHAFHRHRDEIAALAGANRRVIGSWRRYHGRRIYDAVLRAAMDPQAQVPSRVDGLPLDAHLEGLTAALLREGSHALRADVLRALPAFRLLSGRSYREWLEAIEASAAV
jgi:hypothetical protein